MEFHSAIQTNNALSQSTLCQSVRTERFYSYKVQEQTKKAHGDKNKHSAYLWGSILSEKDKVQTLCSVGKFYILKIQGLVTWHMCV